MAIVLIVEDDAFLRRLLVEKMGKSGFTVAEATNGTEVFDYLKTTMPDVILLDLMMPDTDGFEVLQKIKASPTTQNTPVIVLSNLGEKENIEKAMSLGAVDYMVKAHFVPDEIVTKVQSILNK